jgi:hypothetical protein
MEKRSVDMKSSSMVSLSRGLPVTRNLTLVYVFSLVVVLLMTIASAAGLLYPAGFYPTEELQQSFVANDVVNLVLVLPILLGSMWFAWRGKLLGLLFWPGALFVVFYNAVAYVFALPLNVGFLLNLGLVTMSAYTTIGLIASIDGDVVQRRLKGAVSERIAGGVLTGLGGLFLLLVVGPLGGGRGNKKWIAATARLRGWRGTALPGQHVVRRRDRLSVPAAASDGYAVCPERRDCALHHGLDLLGSLWALCARRRIEKRMSVPPFCTHLRPI